LQLTNFSLIGWKAHIALVCTWMVDLFSSSP